MNATSTVVDSVAVNAPFAREARPTRLAALVLDLFVFGAITFIVNAVYGVTQVTTTALSGTGSMTTTTTAVGAPWLTLLGILYFAVPEALFGASVGKQMMGLRVVRVDGRSLRLRDVLIRNLLKPVDFLPVLYVLGGCAVLLSRAAQRIGDMVAGTTVVDAIHARQPGATRTSGRSARLALALALAAAVMFTLVFDYFGRPSLVIEGMFNSGASPLLLRLASYQLGPPRWGFGEVTYPISGEGRNELCSGTISLRWSLFEWSQSGGTLSCRAVS